MAEIQPNKRRNPYADTGLVIAATMLMVMIIKCLIFGITLESIFWFILSITYCILSYKFDSYSKAIKHSTTAFLLLSLFMGITFSIIDRKPQPKMHAFEKMEQDTIAEEIVIEEPVLIEQKEETIITKDTIVTEEPILSNEESPAAEEQTETPETTEETL